MKTSELKAEDGTLDWAVAKCEGELKKADFYIHEFNGAFMLEQGEVSWAYSPSTDWARGGPIIEREGIFIAPTWDGMVSESSARLPGTAWIEAPTPLIAAMRCYVQSKLGDEVEIPEELKWR